MCILRFIYLHLLISDVCLFIMFTLKIHMILEVAFHTFQFFPQMAQYAAIVTVGFHQQIISARVRRAINLSIVAIKKIFADIKVFDI